MTDIHLKPRNINLHNVTYSLISRNPREQMFAIRISFLIVTFLSLISQNLSLVQTTKEVNSYPRIAPCVKMQSVTFLLLFFFFFFLCHLLNVDACVRHIAMEGQVEWTTLVQVRGERIQIFLTSPLCYSIMSHATLILWYLASMLTLQNSLISQALWLPQVSFYRVQSVSL